MTFCEDTTVKASYEGTISSSTLNTDQPMNCTLNLTGIPGNSWLKLWLSDVEDPNTLRCPDSQQPDFSYISLSNDQRICSKDDTIVYYFPPEVSSNTVELTYKTSMSDKNLRFNLNYRGNGYLHFIKHNSKNNLCDFPRKLNLC